MIKVLHCLETIGPGGVEQRRLSLGKYLPRDRYEQVVACSQVIGNIDTRFRELGVRVAVLGVMRTPVNIAYFRRLIRLIRRERPQVIHGAVFEGVISAVVGGLLCGVPVIIIEETSEPANRSWRGHFLFRLLARFADSVVATSPAVLDYLTAQGIHPSKKRLILNGVEPIVPPPDWETNQLRHSLGIDAGDFIVGSVGRMVDNHKLFSVLIKSFASFVKVCDHAKLLLVGDGVDRKQLELLSHELHVADRVLFVGHQADVRSYYAMMDVFALVPAREGFGLAAVEAMFMELPVIATRIGGLAHVVQDGETGLLVTAHDTGGLTQALIRMYSEPNFRHRLGATGKTRAFNFYLAKRYAAEVAGLYEELLKNISQ